MAPAWLRQRFDELLLEGEILTCAVVKLELLHHEEAPGSFRDRRSDLDALDSAPIDERVCSRALEVQGELAAGGGARHRGIKLPDYLIAAAAEVAGLTLLHYDSDYELLAGATGQPHDWIAPRGSL